MVKKFELFEKKLWKKIWKKKKIFFWIQTYVKPNLVLSQNHFTRGGVRGPKIKVAQSGVKHGLI